MLSGVALLILAAMLAAEPLRAQKPPDTTFAQDSKERGPECSQYCSAQAKRYLSGRRALWNFKAANQDLMICRCLDGGKLFAQRAMQLNRKNAAGAPVGGDYTLSAPMDVSDQPAELGHMRIHDQHGPEYLIDGGTWYGSGVVNGMFGYFVWRSNDGKLGTGEFMGMEANEIDVEFKPYDGGAVRRYRAVRPPPPDPARQ